MGPVVRNTVRRRHGVASEGVQGADTSAISLVLICLMFSLALTGSWVWLSCCSPREAQARLTGRQHYTLSGASRAGVCAAECTACLPAGH